MRRCVFNTVTVLLTGARVVALIFLPLLLFGWAESYFHDELFSVARDSKDGEMLVRQMWTVRSARGGVCLCYIRALNEAHDETIQMFNRDRSENGAWRWYRGIPTRYPMVNVAPRDENPSSWLGIDWHGWEVAARSDRKFGRSQLQSPGVTFPYWLATVALVTFTLPWLLRTRRLRHRRKLGLCLTCGYDLRGTPERCPECGAVPQLLSRAGA
jgi:hypothetical protein